MSWIKTTPPHSAAGRLKTLYDRIAGKGGKIDNILILHSLRPHSLEGHMALYKRVLHHKDNNLEKWILETAGVYVSYLNSCEYCFEHHLAGLSSLIGPDRAADIKQAIETDSIESLDDPLPAILSYARALTQTPGSLDETSLNLMRKSGLSDGEILEVNQVVSYFAYANRTVLGLGASLEGDELGMAPSDNDDPDNWTHQ